MSIKWYDSDHIKIISKKILLAITNKVKFSKSDRLSDKGSWTFLVHFGALSLFWSTSKTIFRLTWKWTKQKFQLVSFRFSAEVSSKITRAKIRFRSTFTLTGNPFLIHFHFHPKLLFDPLTSSDLLPSHALVDQKMNALFMDWILLGE